MAEEIKDISLSTKKSFRIDGDNNRIIYLDVSDMNVMTRLEEVYSDINKLALEAVDRMAKAKKVVSDETTEDDEGIEPEDSSAEEMTDVLRDIDSKMRAKLNYIFASDVADVCEPTGNMYDVVGGEWRFEHIIEVLTHLYANNITSEFKRMQERIKKHTAKYTNRRKRK